MSLFCESSLRILRPSTMDLLSQQLNPRKHLLSEDGKLRDYRGLGELAGLSPEELLKVENAQDHFKQLVMLWIRDPTVTVSTLTDALAQLDRHDALDDARALLLQDCEAARSSGLADLASQTAVRLDKHKDVLTLQDLEAVSHKKPLPKYDAMVMFSKEELEDESFAWHLVQRMEAVGLKIFVPSRDLIAGTIEHSASEKIIAQRCSRVVIVFTPELLKSDDSEFLIDLAQYVSIQKKTAMLVPVMFKNCKDLPQNIQMLTKIKYDPKGYVNFYERLLKNVFGVADVAKELTEYPEEFKGRFDERAREQAAMATARVPPIGATANGAAAFSEFSNLSTMSSVRSEDLDTVSTTISTLDSQAGLVRAAPNPPSAEPSQRNANNSSRPEKASPIKRLGKLLKGKKGNNGGKSKEYAAPN